MKGSETSTSGEGKRASEGDSGGEPPIQDVQWKSTQHPKAERQGSSSQKLGGGGGWGGGGGGGGGGWGVGGVGGGGAKLNRAWLIDHTVAGWTAC